MSCTKSGQEGTLGVPKLCSEAVKNLEELPVAVEDLGVGER